MTCLYLHSCLLDLLNLFILSLVSAITLISPVITRMLGSNGELSNRQQCSPNRIISFRKVLDGRYYCWASGGLWLQHWTALGGTWAATACMYNLMFLLLCGFHISISGNCKQCVWQSTVWRTLPRALCASWDGWQDMVEMYHLHLTQFWSSYLHIFNWIVFPLSSIVDENLHEFMEGEAVGAAC